MASLNEIVIIFFFNKKQNKSKFNCQGSSN